MYVRNYARRLHKTGLPAILLKIDVKKSTNAHNQKRKKKLRKQKTRYDIPSLAAIIHPPPRQHLNSRISKSVASKKGSAQVLSSPDQRSYVSP
jgi:hypothetical protein